MNVIIVITSITLITHLYHGLFILYSNPKAILNRLYFLATVCITISAVCLVLANLAHQEDSVHLYFKIGLSTFAIYHAFCFHLTFIFTQEKRVNLLIILIPYLISSIIIIKNTFSSILFQQFIKIHNQWQYVLSNDNYLEYFIFLSFLISVGVICSIRFYLWSNKAKRKKVRIQSRFLTFATAATTIFVMLEFLILPFIFNYRNITLGVLWYLIIVFTTFYISMKYDFLIGKVNNINSEIFSNIDDLVILFDMDMRVLEMNKKTQNCLNEAIGNSLHVSSLVKEYFDLSEKIKKLKLYQLHLFTMKMHLYCENNTLLVDARFSLLKDKYNDEIGVLMSAKEVKEVMAIKNELNLTERQTVIINHLLTGKSAREIASLLSITERTVKAHITTIYNKLGINNRIELFNVIKEFSTRI